MQSSIAFTSIAGGNVPAAICSASLSNVLGVLLTPVLVSQLLPAASGGFSFKAFEDIALAAILVIDLAVLALVIFVTTWASRWLAIPTEDEIAAVFCGSKKSMAGGIPMAAILFPGHAVGLIVLPLMLFHQAQLFVCASLARHYARRSPQSSRLAAAIA